MRCSRRPVPRRPAAQRHPLRSAPTVAPVDHDHVGPLPGPGTGGHLPGHLLGPSGGGNPGGAGRPGVSRRRARRARPGPVQHRGGGRRCQSAVPAQTTVLGAVVGAGGVATVNLGGTFGQLVGQAQIQAVAQIVFTATALPGVTGVTFELAGQAVDVPMASGAQVPVAEPDAVRAARPPARQQIRRIEPAGLRRRVVRRRVPHGRRRPTTHGARPPQMLEVVVGACLLVEDMDEEVAVVHEHPSQVPQSLHRARRPTGHLLHPTLDLVDQGPHLSGVATVGDHEGIGDPEQLTHGQDDRRLTQLLVGGAGGLERLARHHRARPRLRRPDRDRHAAAGGHGHVDRPRWAGDR